MVYRRIEAILVIALVIFSVVGQLLPAWAAGTLSISPVRTQEGNSSGVALVLSVRGAVSGQSYTDFWGVGDPSGKNYTITTTQVAPSSGNYSLTEVYPRDFGAGAGITYVGQYSVAVIQTMPSIGLVAAGQFGIGITDKLLYQRTQVVSIKAVGYKANDMVAVYITKGGVSAPGFPLQVQADAGGNVIASWPTSVSTLTGNYTVSLSGTSTGPKNPPDSQWFIVIPASLGVATVVAANSGNTLAISTTVTEPDGTTFTQGDIAGQFSASGASVGGSIRLLYDQGQGKWTGSYQVQSSDPSGLWLLQVTASDSFGNNGQSSTSLSVIPPLPPPPTPQNPLTSAWFLAAMMAIAASVLIGLTLLKRKRMLPVDLQVDMKAVDIEASRFMGQGFFRSVQEQLVRMKDSTQGDKDG